MKLTLSFTISATAAGNYSAGAYGVTAALDTSDTYSVTFCKAFAPSTPVREAIAQTFESFVLPLHQDTLNQMSDGDYLLHDFDGNLHLSFGAYAGLDRVLYSGQSSVDVLTAFGSPLATLSGAAQPEINASVALDFSFQYATRFEALLSRIGGTARLHLFRSQNATSSTVLKATLSFDANVSASISPHNDVLTNSLVQAGGGAGSPGGLALTQVLSSTNASSEIDKYVAEVNDKLTSWLNRANGIQANLQVAIETCRSRTILAAYAFDLSSPRYPSAWKSAIDGDFVRAFQTGAVTLDSGSGLELFYQQKTTFSCHVFNLWSLTSWNDFSSKASLVYAGNNVFHLVAKVGRTTETDSMGTMHSMNIYFSASADVAVAGQISNTDIDLHIDLTAQNDPKAANTIAAMLSAIEGGPVCGALARGMHAFATNSKKGTALLQVTVPASAYAHINCDPYIGDKPQTHSNYNDAQNWAAFAQAAEDLNAWPLRSMPRVSDQNLAYLKTFVAWEKLNMTATGAKTPNRVNLGEPFTSSGWPEDFPEVDDSSRQFIVYSMMVSPS
jgi:hypothetical protein